MIDERDLEDLRWFLRWAEGDLGLRSNLGAQLDQMRGGPKPLPMGWEEPPDMTHSTGQRGGGKPESTEMPDRMFEMAAKARRVSRALRRIGRDDRLLLELSEGAEGLRRTRCLGRWTCVAHLTAVGRRMGAAGLERMVAEEWAGMMGGREAARQVRLEAEIMVNGALGRYAREVRRMT